MVSLLLSSIILVITCGNCYACSQVFSLQSGVIESPKDANGHYGDHANCTYTIRGGTSAHYVHFIFQRFVMENNYDFLYIGNQRFTGDQTGYGNTYYFDNHVALHFTSDGSGHNYPGFRVSYKIIPDSFSYDFTTLSGIIESPIGRNSSYYPDYAGYVYNIIGRPNILFIQFQFEKFELEQNYDYLFVGSLNFTGVHTGYETKYAYNGTIHLVFTSDGSNHQYAGFRIRYAMITDACSQVFSLQSWFIESPKDIHGYYADHANCTYTIRSGTNAHYVHFIFQRFLMEKNYDFLYIGNQRFTGNQTGYGNTYYFDNHITLHFTSDGSGHNYPGFRISYRIIPDSFSYNFTTLSGIIESPIGRNSSYYPNYAGYVYNIIGSSHVHYIQFQFEKFELERKWDFLFIGSHNFTGIHTGYETEYDIYNNTISLVFTSDGSNHQYAGFKIRYTMISDCRAGYFGLDCTSLCSSGCSDICNKETGRCTCRAGWTGVNCKAACPSGTYDSYCTKSCSPGCVDGSCNKTDGSCSCKSGYTGQRCNKTCPPGTYDSYCTKSCNPGCADGSCNKEDGSCSSKSGYTTARVAGLQATTNLKLIGGVAGGSVAFVLLLVIVNIIYCCMRRKTMNEDINRTPDVNEMRTVRSGMKQTAAFDQPIYDNPIAEQEQRNRDCYESLQYSGDQRPGTSQSVPHASGSKDDDSLYANVPMQMKKKNGYIEGEQCYVNHAMHT